MTWKTQKKIPTASGKARVWWHHDEPSHSSNMTVLRCVKPITRQRAEEFGVAGTMMSLPTTTKWQQRAPS